MKKIVIAADSFKGSLTSAEVAEAIEKGIRNILPDCEIDKVAVADGGEGTVDAIVPSLDGTYVTTRVHDPLMRPIEARYGIINGGKTAVIEMAAASGITLITEHEKDPMSTTSYGTGELILDAYKRGCREFLVGIGGSATNDGGTGMLEALGFRFLDKDRSPLGKGGKILASIRYIDSSHLSEVVHQGVFTIACDVTNPFWGEQGAARVFGPQKGATPEMVGVLDEGMRNFAEIIEHYNGSDIGDLPGAGAAGGLGGAFKAFLGGELVSGIDFVLKAANFEEKLCDCDLIITGEGRVDKQTPNGKTPSGVLKAALRHNVPVIAIGGSVEYSADLVEAGFSAVFPIIPSPVSLEQAMVPEVASANISNTTVQIIKLITTFNGE